MDRALQMWTCFFWICCIPGLVPPHNTAFNFQKITACKLCLMFQVLVYNNAHFKAFAMHGRSFPSWSFKFLLSLKQIMLSCQQKDSDLCNPQMKCNKKEQSIRTLDWRWDCSIKIHYIWRQLVESGQ